ncbi:MAG: primosomal protein N' [Candidatus Nomurabacteria bacterium]|jgi:primosomal protein N' (replication factor Y)|nr:primosomal protein N' [Candidatus Nomurabacteria bacterium]
MSYFEVSLIKVLSMSDTLTYAYTKNLAIGTIVHVPLRHKTVMGVVIKKVNKPSFKTKEVIDVVENTPIPPHLIKIAFWLSKYYNTPLPVVFQTVLPNGLDKTRRESNQKNHPNHKSQLAPPPLNATQTKAIYDINHNPSRTILLHGVTGSGKTNIYIKLILDTLKNGRSSILLVPEIALSSQLVYNLKAIFGDMVTLMHSGQTESVRHQLWQKLLREKTPQIIIGPRSAIFAPVHNLGLIVVDEAHDNSYKQDKSPKYHTLRLASAFTIFNQNLKVIFGTATPNIIDFLYAKQKKSCVSIHSKANQNAVTPSIIVVDLKNRDQMKKHRIFSDQLLHAIETCLKNHQQCLIFHNRRGSASLTLCDSCGWQALCDECLLPLTLHADHFQFVCHACGKKFKVPLSCPECQNTSIVHKGIGTKLIESELSKLFPKARIARFDRDTPKELSMNNIYEQVKSGSVQILIGTQSIAKGFDLPNLALVGVIQADQGLSLPDFSSEERTFQLLSQVVGRVGRNNNTTSAIIQTYQPDHPVIQFGITQNYSDFYEYALKKRHHANFPPFCFLLKLTYTGKTEKNAFTNCQKLAQSIKSNFQDVHVTSPTPAFYEQGKDVFRWQIIIKSPKRERLNQILGQTKLGNNWQFDLDPSGIL